MFEQIGSVSLVNTGEGLAVAYNIPNRFDFMQIRQSIFAKQIAMFGVKWDGPITDIILSDALQTQKPDSSGDDLVFQNITLLQHVEVDHEWIDWK
ncbi:unnamed protein product [Acanthocheilonema viteae]|uniref:Uncharacterized protein n=1 Tax=Acanthocheilonema viteae TaxID=6277 RepID=A0A498SU65_ACAVI|nr:unnamed protein product [Acanthocheilonema viteae]